MDENGRYVTRAELMAHLVPMREDIGEIKDILKNKDNDRWLGPKGSKVFGSLAARATMASLGLITGSIALAFRFAFGG